MLAAPKTMSAHNRGGTVKYPLVVDMEKLPLPSNIYQRQFICWKVLSKSSLDAFRDCSV
jgi:hypothetical protein